MDMTQTQVWEVSTDPETQKTFQVVFFKTV